MKERTINKIVAVIVFVIMMILFMVQCAINKFNKETILVGSLIIVFFSALFEKIEWIIHLLEKNKKEDE
jgi:hypothetical protein